MSAMFNVLLLTLTLVFNCHAHLLFGGLTDTKLNETSPSVVLAIKSINDYYSQQGDNDARTLVTIVKAKQQLVAGMLYHLVLELTAGGQHELCKVKVFSQPWINGNDAMRRTESPCCIQGISIHEVRQRSTMVGSPIVTKVSDTDVQNALTFAAKEMNAQNNETFLRKPVTIRKVTSQPVSGVSYHFYDVVMATTTCLNDPNQDILLKDCKVAANADSNLCDFQVWWQAWMTPAYRLNSVSCK